MEDTVKQLHAQDIYIKPYIDSRLWSVVDGMFHSQGQRDAVKNPDGTLSYECYSAGDAGKYGSSDKFLSGAVEVVEFEDEE